MNPMHQFMLKKLITISFFNYDISFTNGSLAMILTIIICLILGNLLQKNNALIPNRTQAFLELIFSTMESIIHENLDKVKGKKYFNFIFSLFLFVLLSNTLGLLPFGFASTSHISITFTLALLLFIVTLFISISKHGIFFFKIFIPKGTPLWLAPLLFILEFFSYFVRPISLSVRLAANMIAGHIMLDVLASFVIMLKFFGFIPFIMTGIMTVFEFFVALLQSYIFVIFSCVYINEALSDEVH